ncbi:140aa long hypothetical protein [Pyrococcus horikoshii OT3]|uniref:Uncharacterized protein n=1 Tax=Pyrococcus horikoshii (strain ATCC 700860 / DSM 12428 / JCM 9974 / NBRC 100139 / OT-3) TaxID=70601 RepID=O58657_PYRHO|nr:140aa long hypothetical protein [Pyrococcus horikoshii OT3]
MLSSKFSNQSNPRKTLYKDRIINIWPLMNNNYGFLHFSFLPIPRSSLFNLLLYSPYGSSGENLGGCATLVFSPHTGHISLRVYLPHLGHFLILNLISLHFFLFLTFLILFSFLNKVASPPACFITLSISSAISSRTSSAL